MGDMREDFDALKEHNKQKHGERVAKTPFSCRICY